MANETHNKKGSNKSSYGPYIVIGLIFVATVAGIWYISQSGGNDEGNGSGNQQTSGSPGTATETTPLPNYGSAPPGANPPHFKGSESSAVVVEEFADFQCPTCATVHPRMNEINSKYGSRIRFVFRHYPLTNLHPNAYDAAVASEAAGQQGKFWDMQNILFINQPQWSNSREARRLFSDYAQRIGLDVEKFNSDILSMSTKIRVDEDMRRGRALNITGTPSILVNGRPTSSFEINDISRMIDAELEKFNPKSDTAPEKGDATEGANK